MWCSALYACSYHLTHCMSWNCQQSIISLGSQEALAEIGQASGPQAWRLISLKWVMLTGPLRRGSVAFLVHDSMLLSWGTCQVRQHTSAQQREAGPAIHLALEHLQAIDVALNRPLTPLVAHGGSHGSIIPAQAARKPHQF